MTQLSKKRREVRRQRVTAMLVTARLVGVPDYELAPYRTRPIVSNLGRLQELITAASRRRS